MSYGASRPRKWGRCSNNSSPFGPSRIGTKRHLASWKLMWWLIVAPVSKGVSSLQHDSQQLQCDVSVLNWRRTCKDPFAGQWEQILALVQADPTRTSGDLFRELQALFPGRFQPLHIRTLQRGLRKIRAHLLTTREEQWQQELIHGMMPPVQSQRKEPCDSTPPNPLLPMSPTDSSLETRSVRAYLPAPSAEAAPVPERGRRSTKQTSVASRRKQN
jgi:hypothetical protein